MHKEHFGAKLTPDYQGKIPVDAVAVKNVSGRTMQVGKPAVTLFPGDVGAFCDDARGLQNGLNSRNLKIVAAGDFVKQEKESFTKKKKSVANEELVADETTVLETVASDGPETSVQLGDVDVESLPSEQQEGN